MSALRIVMCRLAIVLIAAVLFAPGAFHFSAPAFAQTSGADKPTQGATPGGVNSGSSSDSELWRQIRKGQPGTVSGGTGAGGLMIQSQGQDWRLLRNGALPKYTAWALLGTLLLLSLFFALRGRIKVAHGMSGKTMKRFSLVERVGHWLLASSFIILALTGLNIVFGKSLLIPLLGKDAFSSITIFGKYIHNYVAFAFMLGLVMIAVMWVVHNIPNRHDLMWLLRGGGVIGNGHPPARKFNAGQKIIFWIVILCGVSISMSGWALMNPFTTQMFSGTFSIVNSVFGTGYPTELAPIQEQQYQAIWHSIMATFMVVVILAHIYIGTIGMEGALDAMTSGEVDTNWAREHHSLWVEEEEAKSPGLARASAASLAVAAPAVSAKADAPEPGYAEPVREVTDSKPAVAPKPESARKPKVATEPKPKAKMKSGSASKPKAAKADGTKDDLKIIKGIGPQNERRLNAIGVTRFEHVAGWTKEEQAEIGERLAFPGRIEREDWVAQAKVLVKSSTKG